MLFKSPKYYHTVHSIAKVSIYETITIKFKRDMYSYCYRSNYSTFQFSVINLQRQRNMGNPSGGLPEHFIRFQEEEERLILSSTNDFDREQVMMYYNKTKITDEDMLREYSPVEVRELCERTKVRVKMYDLNSVWDAKRHIDREKRPESRSKRWVNKMLVKMVCSGMFSPYSDLEMAMYRDVARCETKKDNNVRLDHWHGPFTPADVWELCTRTRARVNMYAFNCVWDAKLRFDRWKRLDNRTELWVDKMLEKAVHRGMVTPYSDAQIAKYREEIRCQTRKENDKRLNRWYRERAKASPESESEYPSSGRSSEGPESRYESSVASEYQRSTGSPSVRGEIFVVSPSDLDWLTGELSS